MTTPDGPELVPTDPDTSIGTCTSCGDAGVEVTDVHRVWVTPPAWDTEGRIDVDTDVETWCVVCLGHYPHQLVGDGEIQNR